MSGMTSGRERVLVLDDTVELAELIAALARQAGYVATATTNSEDFHAAMARNLPDLIVLDLQMPGTDGIKVLRQLAGTGITAGILIVSGMDRRTVDSAEHFARDSGLNLIGSVRKPFDPEMMLDKLIAAQAITRRLTGADLGAAMENAEMSLHFQPVIRRLSAQSWHAESVEALPRWQHPLLGWLTPGQFLPLVGSDCGDLMKRLTDFVLQRGIEQLNLWQREGLHLGLRVNVAAGLIADTEFPDRLDRLLQEHGADPALLTLEMSDAGSLAQSLDGIEILTRLRLKEINLSLDDFGAADASMRGLYTLPISEIKIDRTLTADLDRTAGAPLVYKNIIDLANRLGLICCAEGVETEKQFSILDNLGCDRVQGFFVGRPIPAMDIPSATAQWTAKDRSSSIPAAGSRP
jgi:EAL domain-containing protein (putative c-di-GMP-specific phosphodiesterase class I)